MARSSLDLDSTNILGFARKYSFLPGDAAQDYRPSDDATHSFTGQFDGFRHTLIGDADRIARIQATRAQTGRGEAFRISASIGGDVGTPCYFLPWDTRGAIVEINIPQGANGDGTPDIFFTAVLSGCSIIFKGTPQRPTVFHGGTGGTTGGGAPTTGDSNTFWRHLVREAKNLGLGDTRNRREQIKSTDYMVTRSGPQGAAQTHQQAFKQKLDAHYAGNLLIESVTMWGVAFGFRTGADWEFYMQENATIVYWSLDDIVKTFIEKGESVVLDNPDFALLSDVPMQCKARPCSVTRIFPGRAAATITNSWKSLKV